MSAIDHSCFMHGLLPTPCEDLPIPHSSGAQTWDSDESPRYVPENVRDIMTLVNEYKS